MPFTERTPEKLHHMLITDEEQQEKACIVSSCPSSLIENRSPREKCGPSFFCPIRVRTPFKYHMARCHPVPVN